MNTTIKFKKIYPNMSRAKKYVSEIIKNQSNETIIENIYIKELIKYHPYKKIDSNNVEWLKLKIREPYNKPALYYKYKNSEIIEDISWHKCIKHLYGKYYKDVDNKKNITHSFRTEIYMGTKNDYYMNNILHGKCDNCKTKKNLAVDHYILSFQEILDNFIEINKINLGNIEIHKNDNNEIRLTDNILGLKWKNYHDSRARYRLLCGKCNSHFSTYGYKSTFKLS